MPKMEFGSTTIQNVFSWVNITFPNYCNEMKSLEWGFWYNQFKDKTFDPIKLETKIHDLMQDDEVDSKTKKRPTYVGLFAFNIIILKLFSHVITFVKTINSTSSIDKFLFTCKKWVTSTTNFYI